MTGGLNNPFSFLLVAPVVVSAAALKKKSTIIIGSAAVLIVTLSFVFFRTFRNFIWKNSNHPRYFLIWKLGCNQYWNCIFGFLFKSGYVRAKHNERRFVATQAALSREQKLTDLGGVVAAAAHELGTPLATIKLTSSELIEELKKFPRTS